MLGALLATSTHRPGEVLLLRIFTALGSSSGPALCFWITSPTVSLSTSLASIARVSVRVSLSVSSLTLACALVETLALILADGILQLLFYLHDLSLQFLVGFLEVD